MEPTQPEATPTPVSNQPSETPTNAPTAPTNESQKPKGLIIGMVVCAIIGLAGVAFGVYEFMDANQKSQQITELETKLDNKKTEITALEKEISDLKAKDEETVVESETTIVTPETETESKPETTQSNTATIVLGDVLDNNNSGKVFKIGQCSADGGTTASGSHLSVKCYITTPEGEALISYNDNDSILRLVLPNK